MKEGTWVLVANSSKARILKAENNQTLVEVYQFLHPKSRLDGRDIETDRPGSTFNRKGYGRHMMEETTPVKKQESINFAKELTKYLEDIFNKEKLNKMYVAATPAFLGLLRQNLPKNLSQHIGGEIDKDLTTHSLEDIRKHLPYVL